MNSTGAWEHSGLNGYGHLERPHDVEARKRPQITRAFSILFTCACRIYKNDNAQTQTLWSSASWRQLIGHQRDAVSGYRTSTLLNVVWNIPGRVSKTAKRDYFLRHVRPSAWNNSAHAGRIFTKFALEDFSKICREGSSLIKYDKNKGYFTWRSM
jgi:hypothetical protein